MHNPGHAEPPAHQSGRTTDRAAGHSLVRADLPGRIWPVYGAGDTAAAPPSLRRAGGSNGLAAGRRGGHSVSWHSGRGARWPAWLLPVLQADVLPVAPPGHRRRLAGRHEFSWRHAGRGGGDALVCAHAGAALLAGGGLCRALRSNRARRRACRQLHQRRIAGPPERPGPSLGHGVSRRRRAATPSLAGLSVSARRLVAVRATVALRAQAPRHRSGRGGLLGGLWRAALHRRVFPRTRRASGTDGVGNEHGPVAVRSHGDRRGHPVVVVRRSWRIGVGLLMR